MSDTRIEWTARDRAIVETLERVEAGFDAIIEDFAARGITGERPESPLRRLLKRWERWPFPPSEPAE